MSHEDLLLGPRRPCPLFSGLTDHLLQALVPVTIEVDVPFDLHRYIIGQKGSGIRRMMDEFEVTRSCRPFPWRPDVGRELCHRCCWEWMDAAPRGARSRPPSHSGGAFLLLFICSSSPPAGVDTSHPPCPESAGVSLVKWDRQATADDFQAHPR